MSYVELALNLIESISIIVAAGVAVYGLESWRKETKWKREFELKEEVLSLFYHAEDSIARIRNPFSFIGEGKSRERSKDEDPKLTELLDRAFVAYERYDKEKTVFIELRSLKYRFKAVFGNDTTQTFDEIENIIKEIFKAAHMLAQIYWPKQGTPMNEQEYEQHLKKLWELESIFWSGFDDPDKISVRVKQAIKKNRASCETQLRL